jgi:hypothetical protein
MATTLEELQRQLNMNSYTPKTDEQIAQEAQNKYKSQYDAQRLAAQQQAEATDLGLQQQLSQLGTSYDRQMEEAQKATRQAMSQFDRYSLGRGMQRSSYNAASLANLNAQGNKTLNDIQQQRTDQEGNIAAQRALAQQQLAAQLANLDTGYASDVQAAIDALRDQEYERGQAGQQYTNNLLMQLYQLGQTEEQNALETEKARLQNQLLQLQIANYGKKSGGGSGGKGGTGSDATETPAATGNDKTTDMDAERYLRLWGDMSLRQDTRTKDLAGANSKANKSAVAYQDFVRGQQKNYQRTSRR